MYVKAGVRRLTYTVNTLYPIQHLIVTYLKNFNMGSASKMLFKCNLSCQELNIENQMRILINRVILST